MITVGVAAYNAASTLPQLLDSLLEQHHPREPIEIIIADNGSNDATPAIVREYGEKGPFRLIAAAHRRGPAVARNAVIATARGDTIAFIDADCVAHPRWLAEIEVGFRDDGVGCLAGAILSVEPRTATERFSVRNGLLSQAAVLAHPFLPYAQTANAAFRADVFRRIGLFDEEMITGEDADLQWRMQLQTKYRLCYRPEAIVWHKHRGTERGLVRQAMGWGAGEVLLYKKFRDRMPRESRFQQIAVYWRILRLTSLTIRRAIAVKWGKTAPAAFEDAYLSLLFQSGIRLGRLRTSLSARVFYP